MKANSLVKPPAFSDFPTVAVGKHGRKEAKNSRTRAPSCSKVRGSKVVVFPRWKKQKRRRKIYSAEAERYGIVGCGSGYYAEPFLLLRFFEEN